MSTVYSEVVHTSNTYSTHTVVNQNSNSVYVWARSSVVVKALCCKPEGRGFNPDEVDFFFLIDLILPAALWP
jgi:hypothetical protein